jgi:hypothetical protein
VCVCACAAGVCEAGSAANTRCWCRYADDRLSGYDEVWNQWQAQMEVGSRDVADVSSYHARSRDASLA